MLELIISLASGALGGNLAGNLLKKFSLGTLGNSLVGILGGGLGSYLLNTLGLEMGGAEMSIGNIIASIAEGGIGGGALMAIIGVIKNAMKK